MLIITLRTDNPTAELAVYEGEQQLAELKWLAHRELSVSIHQQLDGLLKKAGKTLQDIEGIVVYKGPGSFTGLRIGLSVANALAYGLELPIAGTTGHDWQGVGIEQLLKGQNEQMVMPEYGSEPHITKPKK